MEKEKLIKKLTESIGDVISLDMSFLKYVEITSDLISNVETLIELRLFTHSSDNHIVIKKPSEIYSDAEIYSYDDFLLIKNALLEYKKLELFQVSKHVSDEYLEDDYVGSAYVFKKVRQTNGNDSIVFVFEVKDQTGKIVDTFIEIERNYQPTMIDDEWSVFGEYDHINYIQTGFYHYLSAACYSFERQWQINNNPDYDEDICVSEYNEEWCGELCESYYESIQELKREIANQ
ncbi:hypothetical protein CO725_00835 [Vibrio parahaemolyticus]|uniref:hypothetical protein n=1 Tax=Vibrio parahaemolyticus TaxID=670 RepID=UPI000BE3AF6C|nr:hypothetical protein [Vibrio parahaemolyticus]ATI44231.1 hypothetical protein CO725_00835 [Vibrio parahaemolyticus]